MFSPRLVNKWEEEGHHCPGCELAARWAGETWQKAKLETDASESVALEHGFAD